MLTRNDDPPTVERTLNQKGFMFLAPSVAADYWLASLPTSPAPLLDLGTAFGVHTIHAIKAGRDVVAVDMDTHHLETLRERVAALVSTDEKPLGNLVGTRVATLPKCDLFENNSTAGILMSEVAHFLSPTELQAFMRDAIQWLQPGGRLALTSASVHMAGEFIKAGMTLRSGGSVEEMYAMLAADVPDQEIVDAAHGCFMMHPGSKFASVGPQLSYLRCSRELGAMERTAGFEVECVEYISPRKYVYVDLEAVNERGGETTLFVARKPV
jgi:SAM-dependent methyltransferase